MKAILLITTNEELRKKVAGIFDYSGYSVTTVPDGAAAIESAIGVQPEVILCDLDLPEPGSYTLLHAVAQHASISRIPVILLGSFPTKEDVRKAMDAGADDCLPLPFEGIELLRAVEAALDRKTRRSLHSAKKHADDVLPTGDKEDRQRLTVLFGDRDMQTFRRKQSLYSEGQRATQVWFIASGKVKTFRINEDGKELITNLYGQGDLVGYTEALQGDCYRDSARAVEDTGLIAIPRSEFLRIITTSTELSRLLLQMLARNSTRRDEGLVDLAYNSLRKRVANGLLRLSETFNEGVQGNRTINLSRENLAAIIGAAPESLTRTLSDFKKEKLISMQEGVITLLNEEKLRNLVN